VVIDMDVIRNPLFEKVEKPDYCIDIDGDCGKCPNANNEANTDCMGNGKRFLIPNN
jgi:hypothetical protein